MRTKRSKIFSAACALSLLVNGLTGIVATAQERQKVTQQPAGQKSESGQTAVRTVVVGGDDQGKFNVSVSGPEDTLFRFPAQDFGGAWFAQSQGGPGQTFSFISSEMSFDGKIVKGAPFSAESVTEFTQMLSDGNRIVRKSSTSLYRDSEGRTRREQGVMAFGGLNVNAEQPRLVFINDPVTGSNYVLDANTMTARKMVVPRRIAFEPTASAQAGQQRVPGGALQSSAIKKVQPSYPPIAKAAGAEGAVQVQITVNESGEVADAQVVSGHPLLRDPAIAAAKQWVFKPTEIGGQAKKVQGTLTFNFVLQKDTESNPTSSTQTVLRAKSPMIERLKGDVRQESLGKQMIDGIEAEGSRTIETIPAGAIGNERPLEIVNERWFSQELQMLIMSRQSDPRFGETVYRLDNINRSEPDASLFQIPSDYTVKENEADLMRRKIEMRTRKPDDQQ